MITLLLVAQVKVLGLIWWNWSNRLKTATLTGSLLLKSWARLCSLPLVHSYFSSKSSQVAPKAMSLLKQSRSNSICLASSAQQHTRCTRCRRVCARPRLSAPLPRVVSLLSERKILWMFIGQSLSTVSNNAHYKLVRIFQAALCLWDIYIKVSFFLFAYENYNSNLHISSIKLTCVHCQEGSCRFYIYSLYYTVTITTKQLARQGSERAAGVSAAGAPLTALHWCRPPVLTANCSLTQPLRTHYIMQSNNQ